MGFVRFLRLWVWRAVKRSVGLGDFIASLIGNVVTVLSHFAVFSQSSVSDLAWQIPLYGLAAAFVYRLAVAPYELWQEAEDRAVRSAGEQITWPSEVIHRFENDPVGETLKSMRSQRESRLEEIRAERRTERAAALANPAPTIGLDEAQKWIEEKTKMVGSDAIAMLRDLASVNAIFVWGRRRDGGDRGPLELIPNAIWIDHKMEWIGPKAHGACVIGRKQAYRDLKFSGLQISQYFRMHPYRR